MLQQRVIWKWKLLDEPGVAIGPFPLCVRSVSRQSPRQFATPVLSTISDRVGNGLGSRLSSYGIDDGVSVCNEW